MAIWKINFIIIIKYAIFALEYILLHIKISNIYVRETSFAMKKESKLKKSS